MGKYIIRRMLLAVPILVVVSIISFALIDAMPGDSLSMLVDPTSTAESLEVRREQMGLNDPFYMRYTTWLREVVRGNWGYSTANNWPVLDRIGERIIPTLLLMGTAMLVSLIIAIPIGVITAVRANSTLDYTLTTLAFIGISLPTFFVGLAAIFVVSVKLQWLPTGMMQTPGAPFSISDRIQHLILPVTVLAIHQVALYMRFVRSSLLDVLKQDYVRTARGKGLAERQTILGHALRNGLLPLITLLGVQIPNLFGGAVVTEQIFIWPGIGRLMVESVYARDYPVLMAIIMITAILVLIGNLLTDIAYAWADPRIRYE